jgi:Phage tail assembly chaperone proteins, E, or 41 or 14
MGGLMPDKANGKELNGANVITTMTLRKSVPANGEDVTELIFREPTAADIERCGVPVLLDMGRDPPRIEFDSKAMTQMMATLATVPPSTIRRMDPNDWSTAAWKLAGFFLPAL